MSNESKERRSATVCIQVEISSWANVTDSSNRFANSSLSVGLLFWDTKDNLYLESCERVRVPGSNGLSECFNE